jgi:hypothetical protein
MKFIPPVLAALAFASTVATSQPMPGHVPPRVDVVNLLNLDAQRAEQVEAIMKNTRERMMAVRQEIGRPADDTTRATMRAAMQAIRAESDKQLAEVLTADELAKLRDAMPRPRRPGAGLQ